MSSDINEVQCPIHDFILALFSCEIAKCCGECQHFTVKVQNPTAFEVFQTIGNKNGSYQ